MVSRLRYTSLYDAMKCGMLTSVARHACAPAPMMTRSERPLSKSGTNTISDSPPTQSRSTAGEMMAADWRGTACSRERLMGGEDSAGQNSGKHLLKGVPALVALATFIVFLPALRNGFVAWDDDKNFLTNPDYRGLGLSQLHWMWTTFHLGHYVPLSWMTLGLDYELWGMDPIGYHLTSQLLHAANAVLVYFLARRLLSSSLDAGLRSTTITFAAAV